VKVSGSRDVCLGTKHIVGARDIVTAWS
jgi:hypothetical protein